MNINNYNDNGFIYFSCNIETYHNKDSKLKKKLQMPKQWQLLNKPNYDKSKNGLAIVTGEKSNIFVIDYDNTAIAEISTFTSLGNFAT